MYEDKWYILLAFVLVGVCLLCVLLKAFRLARHKETVDQELQRLAIEEAQNKEQERKDDKPTPWVVPSKPKDGDK